MTFRPSFVHNYPIQFRPRQSIERKMPILNSLSRIEKHRSAPLMSELLADEACEGSKHLTIGSTSRMIAH